MSTIIETDNLTEPEDHEILSDDDDDDEDFVPPPPTTNEYDEEGSMIEDDEDDDEDEDGDKEIAEFDQETGALIDEPISAPISIQDHEYSDSEDDQEHQEYINGNFVDHVFFSKCKRKYFVTQMPNQHSV